jgi:hypothetical protein
MCNDYEQHVTWAAYCKLMQDLALGIIPTRQSQLDLPRADDVRINDLGPVMRACPEGIELALMRFGFPPASPRGGPVFQFPLRGPPLRPEQSLPRAGLCLLRVHRQEISEG